MPMRISSSEGLLFSCKSLYARTIMPGVQKPHCSPCISRKPSCRACSVPSAFAIPSMVRMSAPFACTAKTVQDFTDLPSRSTVQAPQWLIAQEVDEQGSRLDQRFDGLAVHRHRDLGFGHCSAPADFIC